MIPRIENDEQALFLRYWRDQFRNIAIAAGRGLCFRFLGTRTRREVMDANTAASNQLAELITDYERRTRKP